MSTARISNRVRSIPSSRMKMQRELELVCGINCTRIIDRALARASLDDVPEDVDELRSFIYVFLKNQLLLHYSEEAIVARLCEVVATALLSHTGVVRLPEARLARRESRDSHEEIRPPVRMSMPPGPNEGSFADIANIKRR